MGDLVISVDNRLISSLRSAEEVQILLRHGTNLVLRKRDAIVSQYMKPRPLSIPTSNTATITATTTFDNFPPPPSPKYSTRNRSHSMDRISDNTSNMTTTRKVGRFYLNYENF